MSFSLSEHVLQFADDASDAHELLSIGDYVRNLLTVERIPDWQMAATLQSLHKDLMLITRLETSEIRRSKLRIVIACFEDEFGDFLVSKETGSL